MNLISARLTEERIFRPSILTERETLQQPGAMKQEEMEVGKEFTAGNLMATVRRSAVNPLPMKRVWITRAIPTSPAMQPATMFLCGGTIMATTATGLESS